MPRHIEFGGYDVTESNGQIEVKGLRDFSPAHIFECGQCFRWLRQNDGSYTGVAKGRVINISYDDSVLKIKNSSLQDFMKIWFDYFDLGRDYSAVKKKLAKDDIMKEAISFGWGIRLLKQDLWETLVSFIISANNSIPQIMRTIAAISKMYGEEILFEGKSYYTFPDAVTLSEADVERLKECRGGFRCRYISQTSRMVRDGIVDLNSLPQMGTREARNILEKFPGVGSKVADCVLLYGGVKHDVFPTDIWIKRVMEELYFKRKTSPSEIWEFAAGYFGEYAGFAQQYLFYYARENKIGVK